MSDLPGCPCSHCDEDYMNRSVSSVSVGHSADLNTNPVPVEHSLREMVEPPSWGTPSFDNGSRDD